MPESAPVHLALGVLLAAGLLLGLLASRLGLPRVAAYVLAGMCFSPSLLGGVLGLQLNTGTDALTSAALGVVAYLIGGSITTAQLRRAGRTILVSTLGNALGAAIAVWAVMMLVLPDVLGGIARSDLSLAFAAIATTTAPAATVAVLHQYRAQGPLSETLLGVVALDDAIGLILFATAVVVTTGDSITAGLGDALATIAGSVLLGALGGQLLGRLVWRIHDAPLRLPAVFAAILVCSGLAGSLGLSPLLAAMVLGFSARWMRGAAEDRLFAPVENLEEFVFLIFFTVAGARFEPQVLGEQLPLVAGYFLARVAGKVAGATAGARLAGAPPQVTRWLGIALVPQAGVAVGLALELGKQPAFASISEVFVNVILGTTLLYELLGPLAVRFALERAGELGPRRNATKR